MGALPGAGRHKANIDWKRVDSLLEAGCLHTEIAAYFNVCRDTLYKRCLIDHECEFSTYSKEKKSKGESILREHQYNKAIGKTDLGDNTLLIWLGKQRLKQTDKQNIELNSKNLSIIQTDEPDKPDDFDGSGDKVPDQSQEDNN